MTSVITKENLLSLERIEGEEFEDYKKRRELIVRLTKLFKKGHIVSMEQHLIEKNAK